ncbi:MAG: conserved phage C-terminal domain-containing protein, partial [Promethearchaeota archaeon]
IQYLESKENGREYVYFWIKLLLKCLRNKDNGDYGFLKFTNNIPYDDTLLAKVTGIPIDTVRVAMKFLVELEMIEILEDKTIYIEAVNNMIGSESDSAKRVREHRKKKALLPCNKSVIKMKHNKEKKRKEIDKEIDINKDNIKKNSIPYKSIINFLNEKAEKNYKHATQKTKDKIKARFNEGFVEEDFQKVITVKCNQWKDNKKMDMYLRPETLFGPKFEGYLQEYEKAGKLNNGKMKYQEDYKKRNADKIKELFDE